MTTAMTDPTTSAIDAMAEERDRLRAENDRLSRALVAAYTEVEAVKAERDLDRRGWERAEHERDAEHGRAELCAKDAREARAEVEKLRARDDATFVAGYDQAVGEIRDHFAKAGDHGVVHVITTTWIRRSS